MNRVQLESTIASRRGMPRTVVARIIQEMQDVVLESLRAGDKVSLVGFGTFQTRTQKARRGKNPKTGSPVSIPECTKATFRASKTLIQALNLPQPSASARSPVGGNASELKKALILHEAAIKKSRGAEKAPKKKGSRTKSKAAPKRRTTKSKR